MKQLGPKPMVFPLPALLVATYSPDGTPNAMTAAWAASCCHDPPCVGVAVRENRLTYANILAREAFTLSIPPTSLAREVDYLGITSGKREPDKLRHLGLETVDAPTAKTPLLTACGVNVECRLHSQLAIGTHTWFVGEVLDVHADERCLREDGSIDLEALDPLAYAISSRRYHAMGGPVGPAFEMGKQLRK